MREAIKWANENLYGTLGSNILIHPATVREIGRQKFERILAEFKYGMIAVNAWTGVGFLLPTLPWGGSLVLAFKTLDQASAPFTTP